MRQHAGRTTGKRLPPARLGGLQAGRWAAQNIVADIAGKAASPFHYKDKGIMAMIGDGAAIAEMGAHHHELHGHVAFAAWLGVHAWLMSGVRQRVDAFVSWAWDFFGSSRSTSSHRRPRRRPHRLGRRRPTTTPRPHR